MGSLLRGSLPSFYSAEVLLLLINLGKGLPQYGQREGQLLSSVFGGLSLSREVGPVHKSGWMKTDVLPWRPAPSTLFLGGWQQPPCSFMQARQELVAPLSG
jgi:hypothetical protein